MIKHCEMCGVEGRHNLRYVQVMVGTYVQKRTGDNVPIFVKKLICTKCRKKLKDTNVIVNG